MQLPAPVRAAIGLAANAADEARRLPNRAIEMPMLAVSTAVQMSLRAQQRYAALTARGDEVLSRAPGDEPPPWATFDDDLDETTRAGQHRTSYADSRRAAQILEEILGDAGIAHENEPADQLPPPTPITAAPSAPDTTPTSRTAAGKTPAKKTAAKKAAATRTAAKKSGGKRAGD